MQDFWIIFGTECYENEANFHRFNVQPGPASQCIGGKTCRKSEKRTFNPTKSE